LNIVIQRIIDTPRSFIGGIEERKGDNIGGKMGHRGGVGGVASVF